VAAAGGGDSVRGVAAGLVAQAVRTENAPRRNSIWDRRVIEVSRSVLDVGCVVDAAKVVRSGYGAPVLGIYDEVLIG
jgi:hypothetical protein